MAPPLPSNPHAKKSPQATFLGPSLRADHTCAVAQLFQCSTVPPSHLHTCSSAQALWHESCLSSWARSLPMLRNPRRNPRRNRASRRRRGSGGAGELEKSRSRAKGEGDPDGWRGKIFLMPASKTKSEPRMRRGSGSKIARAFAASEPLRIPGSEARGAGERIASASSAGESSAGINRAGKEKIAFHGSRSQLPSLSSHRIGG